MPVQPSTPPVPETSHVIWPGFAIVEAHGPDAQPFLQSQLSSDVDALPVGGWQWSAWLSAKGRVIALIVLLRQADDRYWLLLPDHPAAELASALQRYVLRRKLKLSVIDEVVALPCLGPCHADAVAVTHLGGQSERCIELLPTAVSPPQCDTEVAARWLEEDIRCGVPRLGPEGGTHTAHMLSLDRLQAISLSKGCYPGQEIVARTHYLGQSKRRLGALLINQPSTTAVPPGQAVTRNEQTCGEVLISTRCGDDRLLVQVVIGETGDEVETMVAGCRADPQSLAPPPLPEAASAQA